MDGVIVRRSSLSDVPIAQVPSADRPSLRVACRYQRTREGDDGGNVAWPRIGELLGTSAQAAQQRYGNVITAGRYRAPDRSRTRRSRVPVEMLVHC